MACIISRKYHNEINMSPFVAQIQLFLTVGKDHAKQSYKILDWILITVPNKGHWTPHFTQILGLVNSARLDWHLPDMAHCFAFCQVLHWTESWFIFIPRKQQADAVNNLQPSLKRYGQNLMEECIYSKGHINHCRITIFFPALWIPEPYLLAAPLPFAWRVHCCWSYS